MKTILFVCTGNTCRSSMAESMMRKMLEDVGEATAGIKVISAGTAAAKGQGASKHAIQVMQEKNIDLHKHRSTPLSKTLIDQADVILTMTRNHKSQVLSMAPDAAHKTFTLKEYAGRLGDDKEIITEIEKLQGIIRKKKVDFYKNYEDEIIVLRNQRKELMDRLQAIDDRIKELESEMAKTVENEQREVTYLQDMLPSVDILDPFGQPSWIYRECAKEIEEALKVIIQKITHQ
ncbi:low molecular weight protein arginine phosphatase [Anaerosolibacter sp.]|uniref:low molecular weight protein arginine phosphatase n=1 Tax=Anaerosolibacter sp. TaxID=1872527 RepID=UPI0039F0B61A